MKFDQVLKVVDLYGQHVSCSRDDKLHGHLRFWKFVKNAYTAPIVVENQNEFTKQNKMQRLGRSRACNVEYSWIQQKEALFR